MLHQNRGEGPLLLLEPISSFLKCVLSPVSVVHGLSRGCKIWSEKAERKSDCTPHQKKSPKHRYFVLLTDKRAGLPTAKVTRVTLTPRVAQMAPSTPTKGMATTRDGGLLTTRAIMQAPILVEPVEIADYAFPQHKPKAKALAIQFIAVLIPRPPKPRINRFASTDRRALSLGEAALEHLKWRFCWF